MSASLAHRHDDPDAASAFHHGLRWKATSLTVRIDNNSDPAVCHVQSSIVIKPSDNNDSALRWSNETTGGSGAPTPKRALVAG